MDQFEERIRSRILEQRLIAPGSTVIAGVSGGADSMCLLLVLAALRAQLDFSLRVVHVEHGLRGSASLEDAFFVQKVCREMDIPFVLERIDIAGMAREEGLSTEEAGRKARYACFERLAEEVGAAYIAVAHQAQDQAETVLLNLCRGTGVRGLGAMRMRSGKVIRPLLEESREEIEAYLRRQEVSWRLDETNREDHYARNRIRNQVLPQLAQINAESIRHICSAAAILQQTEDFLEDCARRVGETCIRREGAHLCLRVEALMKCEPLLRQYVLRMAVREVRGGSGLKDFGAVHGQMLVSLASMPSGSRFSLPGGIAAWRENDELCLGMTECGNGPDEGIPALWLDGAPEPSEADAPGPDALMPGSLMPDVLASEALASDSSFREPGQAMVDRKPAQVMQPREPAREEAGQIGSCVCVLTERLLREGVTVHARGIYGFGGANVTVRIRACAPPEIIPEKKYTKWLSYDTITDTLCLRTRRSGDYLVVNAAGGRKKLKDYLIDEKVPAKKRDDILVLAQGSHVLWVIGLRISEAAKVRFTGTQSQPETAADMTQSQTVTAADMAQSQPETAAGVARSKNTLWIEVREKQQDRKE